MSERDSMSTLVSRIRKINEDMIECQKTDVSVLDTTDSDWKSDRRKNILDKMSQLESELSAYLAEQASGRI